MISNETKKKIEKIQKAYEKTSKVSTQFDCKEKTNDRK
jgi:hypothetical protein